MSGYETDRDMADHYDRLQYKAMEPPSEPEADPGWLTVHVGIDVGKVGDPSAIAVTEWDHRTDGQHYMIRRLERLPLGLSYPDQADRIVEMLESLRGMSREWRSQGTKGLDILPVLDTTGVGLAMHDLLTERGETDVQAVSLTATDRLQRRDDDSWSCGKSVLVSSLLVAIQSGRVHLPQGTDADALVHELSSFRMETTATGNVTFNAASGQHDDLIIALGLSTLPGIERDESGQSWIAVGKARRGY